MSNPSPCTPCCTTPQTVNVPGPEGQPGTAGTPGTNGINAFTVTVGSFTVPAVNANVTINVGSTDWMGIGQIVFIENAGEFQVVSKAGPVVTLTYLNFSNNTNTGNLVNSSSQVTPAGTEPTAVQPQPIAAYGSGTPYTIPADNVPALIALGTNTPSITINVAGTYVLFGRVRWDFVGATFGTGRNITTKIRRTFNVAADIANTSTTALTPIVTTDNRTFQIVTTQPVVYTTVNNNDILQLWGSIDTRPTAGSVQAIEASIVAVRIY